MDNRLGRPLGVHEASSLRGLFVALEGADACGKTTHSGLLAKRLMMAGASVRTTSFPRRNTHVGVVVDRHLRRELWLTDGEYDWRSDKVTDIHRAPEDELVFQALNVLDKFEAAVDVEAWLGAGDVVVSSRWWQSAVVYGAVAGLDEERLLRMGAFLPRPHLNVLLTLSEEETLIRRPELRDRLERDRERQVKVRRKYLDFWAAEGKEDPLGWVVVDVEGSVADAHERIWAAIDVVRRGVVVKHAYPVHAHH